MGEKGRGHSAQQALWGWGAYGDGCLQMLGRGGCLMELRTDRGDTALPSQSR